MDTALATGLEQQTICPVFLLRMDMPGRIVRLCTGQAEIAFDGGTFTGSDEVYGSIAGLSAPKDAIAVEETGLDVALLGYDPNVLDELEAATPAVNLWLGLLDIAAGALIGTPELLFTGSMETATDNLSQGNQQLSLACVSIWHKLLSPNDGHALNSAWHEQAWPGEKGLEYTQGLVTAQPSPYAQNLLTAFTNSSIYIGQSSQSSVAVMSPGGFLKE